MIVFRAHIPLSPARRAPVVRALRGILGQTRVLPGCLSCQLCSDIEDDNRLLLIEEWADVHSLRAHLCSNSFRVVLSALEYAAERPGVRFDTIANTRDIRFIAACRLCGEGEP